MVSDNTERLRRNEESKRYAEHDTEPWDGDSIALLMQWDGGEEELALTAELLGRTIEACRQRFYQVRRGIRGVRVRRGVTTTTTTSYIEVTDVEVCPDCWLVHPAGQCDRMELL